MSQCLISPVDFGGYSLWLVMQSLGLDCSLSVNFYTSLGNFSVFNIIYIFSSFIKKQQKCPNNYFVIFT